MTATRINTLHGRKTLKPQSYPYWRRVATGKYIGFYKTAEGGTWRARMHVGNRKQAYESLGGDITSDYEDILNSALTWFKQMGDGSISTMYTVQDAVDDYIKHLSIHKSSDASYRAKLQLTRHLTPKLGTKNLRKLKTRQIKDWFDGLVATDENPEIERKSKSSANRTLNSVKACFNLAWRNGLVPDDSAWRKVTAFKNVDAARILFLTEKQVKRLIETTEGALSNTIRAGVLTGARLGELTNLRIYDFDAEEGSLYVSVGKTGPRTIYLSDDAVNFFEELIEGRPSDDYLLPRDQGQRWERADMTRPFRAAVKKAKLPADTVFYSLRHYFISRALLSGVQIQVIAENCGTSIKMIEKHYGKYLKSDRREMMNKVAL